MSKSLKQQAAETFQAVMLANGASLLWPDDSLIDSDSDRNVFNYDQ